MTIEFEDVSGQPRPDDEIEQALVWAKKRILRPDTRDPEGVIMCITIKDALEELLALRRAIRKTKFGAS